MRYLPLCLILCILPAAFADEKPDPKGVKITTKDGKASAMFPGKPTELKAGPTVMQVFQSKDGKAEFVLGQTDFPKSIDLTDKALIKKIVDASRAGGVRSSKGKLLSQKDIKLGSLPGHTFDVATASSIVRVRFYLTTKSQFQVIVGGSKEFIDGPEAKKFLDSLKIEE